MEKALEGVDEQAAKDYGFMDDANEELDINQVLMDDAAVDVEGMESGISETERRYVENDLFDRRVAEQREYFANKEKQKANAEAAVKAAQAAKQEKAKNTVSPFELLLNSKWTYGNGPELAQWTSAIKKDIANQLVRLATPSYFDMLTMADEIYDVGWTDEEFTDKAKRLARQLRDGKTGLVSRDDARILSVLLEEAYAQPAGLSGAAESEAYAEFKKRAAPILQKQQAKIDAQMAAQQSGGDAKYSLNTVELDNRYIAAVQNGNTEEQQKLVDEAARQAGYSPEYLYWRGDSAPYNELEVGENGGNLGHGLYFTPQRAYAERFAHNGVLRKFYLNADAIDISNGEGKAQFDAFVQDYLEENGLEDADFLQAEDITDLFDEFMRTTEKNAVRGTNVGGFSYGASEIAVQNSWQAKLADPITYDDNGNIIPLSQRFNAESDDIRYSLNELPDGQKYVEVNTNQELFEGKTIQEKKKAAVQAVKALFPAGTTVGITNTAQITSDTAGEIVYPRKRLSKRSYDAKLHASTELDNLLEAGTYSSTAADGAVADKHTHANADRFDYYETIFKVGDEWYKGFVNVMIMNDGSRQYKDVATIKNITDDIVARYGSNNPSARSFISDRSIVAQNGSDVNTSGKYSLDELASSPAEAQAIATNVHETPSSEMKYSLNFDNCCD